MAERADYAGLNGFVWWHGVVEDINDPLKIGRVRVRILGWHTENKTDYGIPTKDLPWAQVMQPITSAAMTGIGTSPTGVLQGSWVIGFFLDGHNAQQPLVMGTYGGIQKPDILVGTTIPYDDTKKKVTSNSLMNYELGFRDPNGIYPTEGRMNEPDTNRLARNENVEWTIVKKKKDTVVGCDTALYGHWQEPPTPYAAQYPYNHVTETKSGHIFEIDDTPSSERIHTYHKSGTFNEVHPNGSLVHKVVGNEWNITLNDKMIYVAGNTTLNSDKMLKIRVGASGGGNFEIETEGDMRVLVKGNTVMETKGNFLHKVGGKYTVASDGNMLFVAPQIDLNPQGTSSKSITTSLSELRKTTKKVYSNPISLSTIAQAAAEVLLAGPIGAISLVAADIFLTNGAPVTALGSVVNSLFGSTPPTPITPETELGSALLPINISGAGAVGEI